MRHPAQVLAAAVILTVAGLACGLPVLGGGTPPAAATLSQLYTAAALTVQASIAQGFTATPSITATKPFPTLPTAGPSQTPAPVSLCDAASFVRDVTIPDNTTLIPGGDFTKIWRIQNIGTCIWTPAYSLVFVSGSRMDAPARLALAGNVNPGQSVDLSADMSAPDGNGQYQGFWQLRNPAGYLFGIGPRAQDPFWVKILVAGPSHTAYDFAADYCDASWENNNRDLPCPGSEGDGKGYVIAIDHPTLENGMPSGSAGLLTVPKDAYNGMIAGRYPPLRIQEGDHFQALVNCQYKAYSCRVTFQLLYQVDGAEAKELGHWYEAYEGKFYPVDIDLGSLAGKRVRFTVEVTTYGPSDQDQALWIDPRITRRGNPPATDTPTPTPTPFPTQHGPD
jgi:hypothetical protein